MDKYQQILVFIKQDLCQLQQDIHTNFDYNLEEHEIFQNIHRNLVCLENKFELQDFQQEQNTIEYSASNQKQPLRYLQTESNAKTQQSSEDNILNNNDNNNNNIDFPLFNNNNANNIQQQQYGNSRLNNFENNDNNDENITEDEEDLQQDFSQHQKILQEYRQSVQKLKKQNKMIQNIVNNSNNKESKKKKKKNNDDKLQLLEEKEDAGKNLPRLFEERREQNKRNLEQFEKEIQEFIPSKSQKELKNNNIYKQQKQQQQEKQHKKINYIDSSSCSNNFNNNGERLGKKEKIQKQINKNYQKIRQVQKAEKYTNKLTHDIDNLDQEINLLTNTIQRIVSDD